MGEGLIGRFRAWLSAPYREGMSAVDWFLFLGLVIVAAVIWSRIVAKVAD